MNISSELKKKINLVTKKNTQEANIRPGRASPQNLNHKKAAVELLLRGFSAFFSYKPSTQTALLQRKPMITDDEEVEVTFFCVCFHLSPKLQGSSEIIWV